MTTRIAPGVGANLLGQHSAERNQDATVYVGNLEPKDRVTNAHQGYGFVEFRSEEDADYASQDKKSVDVGANLFIGNLDPIMRDPETGNSRGFGFISYDSFDASDAAIETMNGQYLCNRQITVSYAYKKDTKGEQRVLAASNPTTQRSRPHTMFASGPPTIPPQQNGAVSAPVPPRPFGNGTIPPPPMPALRPPPPQNVYQPMQMHGTSWQGQPPQPGGIPPPQMQQQFRGMPPPPPPQMNPGLVRPPPPPAGMVAPPVWRPPPPPQQLGGGPPHSMQHMSMQPSHQPMHIPPPPPPQ
ncbi:hypothetical protein DH2020_012552 [Rehmannia glutinosa]|uniref:RRM domain-containing protein n=1 Tax=Rehmannia glutinosa TaxID=99300 RepID=A0ABR0X0Z2_REHGL